ncbi:MAG: polysaccharide pyruvyl transferase family protein [Blautia sp.]
MRLRHKKKIFIKAFLVNNFGDDLFVKVIAERYPNIKFYILTSKENGYTFRDFDNVKNWSSNSAIELIDRIFFKLFKIKIREVILSQYADLTAFVGGSVFIEQGGWQKKAKSEERLLNISKEMILMGANFGPYYSTQFLSTHKKMFSKYKFICFRDQYSLKLFEEIEEVHYAPDIVFSLNANGRIENNIEKRMVIVPANVKYIQGLESFYDIYITKMVEIVNELSQNEWRITFLSFCEAFHDDEIIEEICKRVNAKSRDFIKQVYYKKDMSLILVEINRCEYIIANRYHAMILGWLYRKKVFPIIYNQKQTTVLNDLCFEGGRCKVENIDNLTLQKIIKESDRLPNLERIIEEAQLQFQYVDEWEK